MPSLARCVYERKDEEEEEKEKKRKEKEKEKGEEIDPAKGRLREGGKEGGREGSLPPTGPTIRLSERLDFFRAVRRK